MSENIQMSTRKKLPLQGVVIFVSQQLVSSRMFLHKQCTALGGKFVWVFDVPFTHYICQGKLSKRGKEYKKAEEYRATCVHPAWLKACQSVGQRVAEKLYATTYNPNRSLIFVSMDDDPNDDDDDNDEENAAPLLTIMSSPLLAPVQSSRIFTTMSKKKEPIVIPETVAPPIEQPPPSPPVAIPTSPTPSLETCDEFDMMLKKVESYLAQCPENNQESCPVTISTKKNNKSWQPAVHSINTITNKNIDDNAQPTLSQIRVEWIDEETRAERQKCLEEDEDDVNNQETSHRPKKRQRIDSQSLFNGKKSRI